MREYPHQGRPGAQLLGGGWHPPKLKWYDTRGQTLSSAGLCKAVEVICRKDWKVHEFHGRLIDDHALLLGKKNWGRLLNKVTNPFFKPHSQFTRNTNVHWLISRPSGYRSPNLISGRPKSMYSEVYTLDWYINNIRKPQLFNMSGNDMQKQILKT
jgi:hypothetical protein